MLKNAINFPRFVTQNNVPSSATPSTSAAPKNFPVISHVHSIDNTEWTTATAKTPTKAHTTQMLSEQVGEMRATIEILLSQFAALEEMVKDIHEEGSK